jgi:hypothetical protein
LKNMPGILDTIRGKMAHATGGGGILSGLTGSGGSGGVLSGLTGSGGSGGVLSAHVGILQSRLATAQAASGGPLAKVQAIMGNNATGLGAHLRTSGGGLLSGIGGGGGSPPATDAAMQVAGASRIYSSPTKPAGIEYK